MTILILGVSTEVVALSIAVWYVYWAIAQADVLYD